MHATDLIWPDQPDIVELPAKSLTAWKELFPGLATFVKKHYAINQLKSIRGWHECSGLPGDDRVRTILSCKIELLYKSTVIGMRTGVRLIPNYARLNLMHYEPLDLAADDPNLYAWLSTTPSEDLFGQFDSVKPVFVGREPPYVFC